MMSGADPLITSLEEEISFRRSVMHEALDGLVKFRASVLEVSQGGEVESSVDDVIADTSALMVNKAILLGMSKDILLKIVANGYDFWSDCRYKPARRN